jgi:hypothetical protein
MNPIVSGVISIITMIECAGAAALTFVWVLLMMELGDGSEVGWEVVVVWYLFSLFLASAATVALLPNVVRYYLDQRPSNLRWLVVSIVPMGLVGTEMFVAFHSH